MVYMKSSVRELRWLRNLSTCFLSRKSPIPSSTKCLYEGVGKIRQGLKGSSFCFCYYGKWEAHVSYTVLKVEVSVEFEVEIVKAEVD